ncbi:MAG TPA: glycosyltransferase family 87 protein [Rhizomicrobium sp.]|jgi:hypothetical protein
MAKPFDFRKFAATLSCGIALAWAACLAMMFRQGTWILDGKGQPIVTDFIEVWAAGRTTLHGAAASTYDPKLHHAAQVAVAGHAFHGFLWWHYPPFVLFAAMLLALLPYAVSFFVWVAATLAPYAITISLLARSRLAWLIACASPAVFINAVAGQNGYTTAALIGAVVLNLQARPILAGAFLGLLTYKPQFGLLFPLVLVVSGRWRAFWSAAAVAISLIAASWLAFGSTTLKAFAHFLPLASQSLLVDGSAGWKKLQSIYGLARCLGVSNSLASGLQGLTFVACAVGLLWLWRRAISFETKAAALSVATLLATPYAYMYDFPILAVPLALLWRERPFDRVEFVGIGAAGLFLSIYAFGILVAPMGPFAAIAVVALIARRVVLDSPSAVPLHFPWFQIERAIR